jgi:hypothetical protein
VEYGDDQSFTITAAEGYHIADVLVDEVSVGVVGSYTFEDVTANHTIAASFAEGEWVSLDGSVSVNIEDDVDHIEMPTQPVQE